MKPLPTWAIQSYAEGRGPQAQLAQMLIEAEEVIDQHEQVSKMQETRIRRLMEQNERLKVELLRFAEEVRDDSMKSVKGK